MFESNKRPAVGKSFLLQSNNILSKDKLHVCHVRRELLRYIHIHYTLTGYVGSLVFKIANTVWLKTGFVKSGSVLFKSRSVLPSRG